MPTSIYNCFLCQWKMKYLLKGYDYLYKTTEKGFKVYKCPQCKLEQILPIPDIEEIKAFYPKKYYSYNVAKSQKRTFFTKIREKIIEIAYNKKLKKDIYYFLALIAKLFFSGLPLKNLGNKNFLDIGCGDGYNLALMEKYGWNCYGFEIGEKNKIKNVYYDFSLNNVDFDNLKFDYIRIWHVLEHVSEPIKFIKKVKLLLSKNGELIIGIPNTKSLFALFGKYWYNRDVPRHIVNYNIKNLQILLSKHNLKIIEVKHLSSGGLVGSLQHFLNNKFNLNINLINKTTLVLLLYPLDLICNLFKIGDCISVKIIHK